MGILQVVCGDISEFRVRKFDKPPPGDVPSNTKAHNPRALLAFEEEILQIADCLAGVDGFELEHSRFEPRLCTLKCTLTMRAASTSYFTTFLMGI